MPGVRQHRGHHGQRRQCDSAATWSRDRAQLAHGVVSFRRTIAAMAATAATSKASEAVPTNATVRGVLSFGAGAGGTATGFAVATPGSLLAGSSHVSAATGSTLPAPTTLDGARAPLCAVAVMRCTTCVAFRLGYLLRTSAATPAT